jgi:putative membrane protein
MRLIRLLIALLCVAAGVVIGALNAQPITLDLGFTDFRASAGVCVLLALLVGALVGGLAVSASVVAPLRLKRSQPGSSTAPDR